MQLFVASDSHLSPRAAQADDNWSAVIDEVTRRRPDIVVHTGDISLDGANDRSDLEHARSHLDRLSVPWLAIPGNHDIGDVGAGADAVDDQRRQRYDEVLGNGSWVVERDGWRLVGIDLQTLLSPLSSSDELWRELGRGVRTETPTALFLHRPIAPLRQDEVDEPRRYVTGPDRHRLLALIGEGNVRVIVSGHVHQWRDVERDGRRHVWAPSTWAVLPGRLQPRIGTKVTGIVVLDLSRRGPELSVELVRPVGMTSMTIGDDLANPYG